MVLKALSAALAATALCCSPCIAAQAAASHGASTSSATTAPTTFGHPSLEGVWAANFLLTLEAEKDAPALTLPEPEAKRLSDARAKEVVANFTLALDPEVPALIQLVDGLPLVRGERRTRMVTLPADGRLPMTPEGRKELEAGAPDGTFDNPEERPNAERCLVGQGQAPYGSVIFGSPLQILQTREHVVLHSEYGDDMRVIPFADRHGPQVTHSRLGDSIARWEGATLVIETTGLPDADRDRFFPSLVVSGDATVVERLTRVSDKELLYQFTVIDPKVYTAPWQAEFSWYATQKLIYEHACHEGNYALSGILAGARHDEAVAKAKAAAAGDHR